MRSSCTFISYCFHPDRSYKDIELQFESFRKHYCSNACKIFRLSKVHQMFTSVKLAGQLDSWTKEKSFKIGGND